MGEVLPLPSRLSTSLRTLPSLAGERTRSNSDPAKPASPARLARPLSRTGKTALAPLRIAESDSPSVDAALLARSGVMSVVRLSSNEAAMRDLLLHWVVIRSLIHGARLSRHGP
jgi:hypothetical protein